MTTTAGMVYSMVEQDTFLMPNTAGKKYGISDRLAKQLSCTLGLRNCIANVPAMPSSPEEVQHVEDHAWTSTDHAFLKTT